MTGVAREFGARLAALMRDRGMTIMGLARASGVGYTTVRSYVREGRMPNLYTLVLIRDALGCAWDELLP